MSMEENRAIKGLRSAFKGRKRTFSTLIFSFIVFSTSVLIANIPFTRTILSEGGISFLPAAIAIRSSRLLGTSGITGGLLTVAFSLLVGITLTNTLTQLSMKKFDKSMVGSLPGFLAGGCASCGVGILHVVGLGGVVATLPFSGNLLRLGGVTLLIGLLWYNGDPETCRVNQRA